MDDIQVMRSLIAYTRERALAYRTFTGAFIVREGEVISRDITSIDPDQNPLAHAELKAVQGALTKYGLDLKGCHLYTTQRPCPMCASAVVWSGIEKVVYGWAPSNYQWGTSERARQFFADLDVECVGPILEDECRAIDEYLIANGV